MKFAFLGAMVGASMMVGAPALAAHDLTGFVDGQVYEIDGISDVLVSFFDPNDAEFTVSGAYAPGTVGPVSADFGRSGLTGGEYLDIYQFRIDQDGSGSGGIISTATSRFGPTDLDILWVEVNGIVADHFAGPGIFEAWGISGVPIAFGELNSIAVRYTNYGIEASYAGNATFEPIPEPGTWAMMIAGFGLIGLAARNKRRTVKTTLA